MNWNEPKELKAVVILSGGMDSAVLLAQGLDYGYRVHCLTIDYGQRHRREIEAARALAGFYEVPHEVLNLSNLGAIMRGSSQTDKAVEVPHGHYAAETMKQTVVPNRNMILLAVAGAYAISLRASCVAYAAHAGDHAIYPDCRPEFVHALDAAMQLADWHRVSIERPFINKTKADIARLGAKLHVPFVLTYSCYEGKKLHCGLCGTCVERREAFERAGIFDPTTYANTTNENVHQNLG